MKYFYKIISALIVIIFIAGCSSDFVDSFSPIPRQELLKHPNGSSVRDCQGGPLPLGDEVEFFLEKKQSTQRYN